MVTIFGAPCICDYVHHCPYTWAFNLLKCEPIVCIIIKKKEDLYTYTSLFTKQVAQNNKTHKYSNSKNNDNLTTRT